MKSYNFHVHLSLHSMNVKFPCSIFILISHISTFASIALSFVLICFNHWEFDFLSRLKGDQNDPLNSSRNTAGPAKQLSLPNVSFLWQEQLYLVMTLLYFGHNWTVSHWNFLFRKMTLSQHQWAAVLQMTCPTAALLILLISTVVLLMFLIIGTCCPRRARNLFLVSM